jgi:glycosyltransferase involved in cell wall biosynthesis
MNKTLNSFKDIHKDKDILVCGCGESLRELRQPERFITIGVNDVGRLFHPNYLVVVNPKRQFMQDRFRYVETSQAEYLFTQLDLAIGHPNIIKFRLGKYCGTDLSDPDVLPYTQNSPYVALCLAALMGAKRIGLIGVDFAEHHFFGKTGTHALAHQVPKIDAEYRALRTAMEKSGIEVFNLSPQSRLTAFERLSLDAFGGNRLQASSAHGETLSASKRVFFVHYKFLSCGDGFKDGLHHAAEDLGLDYSYAYWDDPHLPDKVRAFGLDLLFIIHGRSCFKRWGKSFGDYNTAVWLLDEPYEVDDTSAFSGLFRTVFVNDPATLHRHENAHYLPVCFDPHLHAPIQEKKNYNVGFIGGHNVTRQNYLKALEAAGLLSYVVGGPWRDEGLGKKCLAGNIAHSRAAHLYQQTRIVLNVFRDIHHFNREKLSARSLNPRIYEALACGALVVSEKRPEIDAVFPELPVFKDTAGLVAIVRDLLDHPEKYEAIREACHARLNGHTYRDRLSEVIRIACHDSLGKEPLKETPMVHLINIDSCGEDTMVQAGLSDWEDFGGIIRQESNGVSVFQKDHDWTAGSERGLVSQKAYSNIDLSFEVNIDAQACFISKIHQTEKVDQLTNSYHLFCHGSSDYFARHNHIFKRFRLDRNKWEKIRLILNNGTITIFRNGQVLFSVCDRELLKGHAFLGIKSGRVLLKNIKLKEGGKQYLTTDTDSVGKDGVQIHCDQRTTGNPLVSIITTVYDRIDCLRNCIRSVGNLNFQNYEHIIIADCPPEGILNAIRDIVEAENDNRIAFLNLAKRYNDWGIQPASVGIGFARGKYVCFLSDDNGYSPEHLDALVNILENDEHIGFAYSACRYDGRLVLDSEVPRLGRIDLGQPLFRKTLFDKYFGGKLPFKVIAWDWEMIKTFMQKGVKWKYHNNPSFLFRLKKYRQLSISLIHPSRGRAALALQTHSDWMGKTSKNVEIFVRHYLSLDNSDQNLNEYKEKFEGVTNIVIQDNDSVVQATNNAAYIARGDLLIYLSDDFTCPSEWDLLLATTLEKRKLDARSDKFIIKVDDCLQDARARVLTIPMMSRPLFKHLRYFWYPEYKSMFSDMDLFEVCSRLGVIIDATDLKFEHRHYSVGKSQNDETYKKTAGYWDQGQKLYNMRRANNFGLVYG